jgi:hypothetical protein
LSSIPAGGPFKAAMGIAEPLSKEHLKKTFDMISAYCGSKQGLEYCEKFRGELEEAALLIAFLRLKELGFNSKDKSYDGLDKGVFEFINKLAEVYAAHIVGKYMITETGHVVARARKTFQHPYKKSFVVTGEYLFLALSDSVLLSALGFVDPVPAKANI